MAKKVAVINMKGGVGKSTLSVNLSWHFFAMPNWAKRVLLIDLDPQFNSSQYVLGMERYHREVYQQSSTIWDIFEQATRAPGLRARGRDLRSCVHRVETRDDAYLDIIPSQLELSNTLKNPTAKEQLLSNFVASIEDMYDLVIVDCAPTESVLTSAAYLTCDFVLVPVKPEFLCTIGLPLIQQSMSDFSAIYRKSLSVAGICFNGCSGSNREEMTAKSEVRKFAKEARWKVFSEEVPFSRSFPRGAREGRPIFSTGYSRTDVCREVAGFCNSFARSILL